MADESIDGVPDNGPELDAGLRIAFGPHSTLTGQSPCGVLATIEESSGVSARILLRDEPDGPGEVVSPLAATSSGGMGRYQVAGEIARGGVGVVLKGRDVDLGREIALKILRSEHAANPAMIRRLIEEAQIGGQLQHPGVLPVYEMGIDAAHRPFFAMKLVRGRTLAALLHDRLSTADNPHRLLGIFLQVCQAMAYAHARGVIHRDLKPSNIMVGSFGEMQVVDWGLAKVLAQGGVADEAVATIRTTAAGSQSEVGSVLGTPSYMAPEQARGEVKGLDERCDVFALGAILCEILTGTPPYTGNRTEVLRQAREGHLDDCFARLDSSAADRELIAIAKKCLDPAQDLRYRDAGRLADDLNRYLASVADRMRAAEMAAAEARARASAERKARRLTAALAAVLLVSIAGVGGMALLAERNRARAIYQQVRATQEKARADAQQLIVLRERNQRLEDALALIGTFNQKTRWLVEQAKHVPAERAEEWVKCIGLVREAVERTKQMAPDPPANREREETLDQLRNTEAELRERAAQSKAHPAESPAPPR